MLAPNGRKSNLNADQYYLVRTLKFKEWFGDWENDPANSSKVVDENGEPLVVWHYSKRLNFENERFNIFKVDRQLGSHFGSLNQVKNLRYIKGQDYLMPNIDNKDFRFYQVFLNIKTPIRLKDVGIFEADTLTDGLNDIQKLKDYDWEYINNYTRKSNDSLLDRIKHIAKGRGIDGVIYLNRFESSDDKSIVHKFEDASDSVFKSEIPNAEDSFIAFYPEQIKLADGTNTTFDSSNPDIRYAEGGETGQQIVCVNCGWGWNTNDSEDYDKYICHNCGFDNRTYYDAEPIGFKDGGRTISQTPSPKKDRIHGSKVNAEGSASSEKSAKDIYLSEKTTTALNNKLKEFKETHNTDKVSLNDLKAVYRRGLGAYSSSHRPNIPRNAWAMARVNAFLRKAGGGEHKKAYVQDDDLLKYADGGEVHQLINDGIVELKMYDSNNEHSKIYGFDAEKPLYIQSINVLKEHRNKGIGSNVMKYIVEHAKNNGNDLIIGHITQKAEPNIDVIKSMLLKSGFKTIDGNNDFYKIINNDDSNYAEGGEVDDKKKTYDKWKSLVNMSYSELDKFYNSEDGKKAGLSSSEAKKQGIDSGRESARMILKMKSTPKSNWTDTMWKWAKKQISFISRMSGMKGDLYDDKGNKTRKHTSLLIWGHNPKKYKAGGETSTDMKFNDGVIYHEKNDNPFIRKNTIYYWLYDNKDAGQKLNDGEYDIVMFPPATMSMAMQKGFVPPLQLIWTKKYQNKTKGSEHLIGIIQAYYLEKQNKLYIEMMTSNPKMRGKGIMSYMVKELRNEFGVSQNDLIFVDTTKEGKRFEQAKHYDLGGELEKLGITQEQRENWREEHRVKQKQKQNPNVLEYANQLQKGEISQDDYLKKVKEYLPIRPFTQVPKIPTLLEITGALDSNKVEKGIIGYTKFIEDGEYVASRLDIPAYEGYDIWVVSVHNGNKEGNVIGYGQTAYLKDITFVTSPKSALNIATNRTEKRPFARMKGSWINKHPQEVRDMAVKYMNDKNWVQVGMNPYRHSWFYDKSDGMPLLSAEEVIQVGALVLAKNPVKTTPDNEAFIVNKDKPNMKFKDGGLFKSHKSIEQIAKEKNVPLVYAKNQLIKGMKTESEHSNSKKVQKTIALQHLDEMMNYYTKLKTIEK